MTDGSQSVVNRYAYTPYGRIVGEQESVSQPFKYVGQYGVMAETNGFCYMRARYYDPSVGRFISEDPLGFVGGTNLSAYATGNPITLVDPSGEFPLLVILPVVGGTISGAFSAADVFAAGGGFGDVATAFGRGFVSGATGTLVAIGVGVATGGNAIAAGAAGGAVGNLVDQALSGNGFDPLGFATATIVGGVLGPLVDELIPTRGRLPNLLKWRNFNNFGPNSIRLTGREALGSTFSGTSGVLAGHAPYFWKP